MQRHHSRTRRNAAALGALMIVMLLTLGSGTAGAGGAGGGTTGGSTALGPLSATFWRWVLAQPAATNPLIDSTGAYCAAGQRGPVFFLVGSPSGTADRTCTVPRGRAVFFPMVNAINFSTPGDGLNTPAKIWRDLQVKQRFRVDSVYAVMDGVPLVRPGAPDQRHRGCVGPARGCSPSSFAIDLPADNFWGFAPGAYQPAVSDGYYVLLPSLAPGTHEVRFGGKGYAGGAFSQSITYTLRVR